MSSDRPDGFDDPPSCRAIRWINTVALISIGTKKWSEKNRFRVGCDTEKFPHIHSTNSFPRIGIAESRFVITVAPQNDICPQGRTYPRKAAAIVRSIKINPVVHTMGFFWGEEK